MSAISEPQTGSVTSVVRALQAHVRDRYVFADVASTIAAGLDDVPGTIPDGTDDEALAAQLTHELQSVNGDLHLRVRLRDAAAQAGTDEEEFWRQDAVRNAAGVRSVRRDGTTGILELAPYLSPEPLARAYVTAAFSLLAGADHLIIDVRACVGSDPDTVALICGYLLGDRPVHLQDLVPRDGAPRSVWTEPADPAIRVPAGVGIHVLTSRRTFSGGEELAYNLQVHDRAVLVGEVTGGGAHPREAFELSPTLEAHIPVARSVNAITGTNWEQVGVHPDLPCDAASAWQVALNDAQTRSARP